MRLCIGNGLAFLAVLAALPASTARLLWAQNACDSRILSLAGGGQPYSNRGDRCEGTYRQPVSAGLHLRSVYQSYGSFDLRNTQDPLKIEWSAPKGGNVTLRADGWVGREPYRMDASPAPGTGSFIWQTPVLRALSSGSVNPVDRDRLGVRAWSDSSGVPRFLPVRIWQHGQPKDCGPINVALWANTRPESVYVQVTTVGAATDDSSSGVRELDRRPYPLNGALTFPLPELQASGLYLLKISAKLGATDRWAREYLILLTDDVRSSCT